MTSVTSFGAAPVPVKSADNVVASKNSYDFPEIIRDGQKSCLRRAKNRFGGFVKGLPCPGAF